MTSNPILARIIRDLKFPNVWQTIALTIGLAIATSLVTSYVAPVQSSLMVFSVLMLTFFGPTLITVLAAFTAASDSHTEAYTLLKLTSVPHSTIVWGYFWATLFRARLLLVTLIGVCVPAYIIYQALSDVPVAFPTLCHILVPPGETVPTSVANPNICVAADDPRVLASNAIGNAALATSILAAIPLTMLGVTLGLAGRRTVGATTIGTFAAMLMAGILIIIVLTLLGPAIGSTCSSSIQLCVVPYTWPPDPIPPLIYLGGLTLATLGLASLASRFA